MTAAGAGESGRRDEPERRALAEARARLAGEGAARRSGATPWPMSELLLQAAYTMPVAVNPAQRRPDGDDLAYAFTPALVVIVAQLVGALSMDRAVG